MKPASTTIKTPRNTDEDDDELPSQLQPEKTEEQQIIEHRKQEASKPLYLTRYE